MKIVSLLLLVCFVVLSWFYGGVLLEHQLAVWLILICVCVVSSALFKPSWMDLFFLSVGLWIAIASIFSNVPHDTQKAIFRLGVPLWVYVAARWSFSAEKHYRELLGGCVIAGSCLSLFGWGQAAGFFDSSFWADPAYPACRYVNHNHWAGYLELLIPLGISLAFSERVWRKRFFWGGCTLMLAASHLSTLSRAGLLSLGAGLALGSVFFLLIKGGDRTRWRVGLASVGVVLLMAFLVGGLALREGPWKERFRSGRETGFQSVRERTEIWESALGIVAQEPLLGTGPGTFGSAYTAFMVRYTGFACQHAHNEWLQAGSEGGVPFLLLLLVLPGLLLREGLRTLRHPEQNWAFRIGALSSLVAGGLHACMDLNAWFPAQLFLMALLCAALTHREAHERRPAPWILRSLLLLPLGLILALGGCLCYGGRLKADALEAKEILQWEKSIRLLKKASRFRPYDADLPYERATLWRMRSFFSLRPRREALSRAEKELRSAVLFNPYHLHAWLLLCDVVSRREGDAEAQSLYEEVRTRFPTSPHPALWAGRHSLRSGDRERAKSQFRKGFRLWPDVAMLREGGRLWEDETGEPASLGMAGFLPEGKRHPLRFFVIGALVREGQWEMAERESRFYLQGEGSSSEARHEWMNLFETHGGKERGIALLQSLEGS